MGLGAGQIVYEDDFKGARFCQLRQLSPGQTIPNNTLTALTFGAGSEDFDDDNWHDTSVNPTRITPTIPGVYRARVKVVWSFNTSITACYCSLGKNGSAIDASGNHKPNSTNNVATFGGVVEALVYMNGTTDYIEGSAAHVSTGSVSQTTNSAASGYTMLTVELVRPD